MSSQLVEKKKEKKRKISRIVAREIEIEGDQINLYFDLVFIYFSTNLVVIHDWLNEIRIEANHRLECGDGSEAFSGSRRCGSRLYGVPCQQYNAIRYQPPFFSISLE